MDHSFEMGNFKRKKGFAAICLGLCSKASSQPPSPGTVPFEMYEQWEYCIRRNIIVTNAVGALNRTYQVPVQGIVQLKQILILVS
jgi:hypothetical protein